MVADLSLDLTAALLPTTNVLLFLFLPSAVLTGFSYPKALKVPFIPLVVDGL